MIVHIFQAQSFQKTHFRVSGCLGTSAKHGEEDWVAGGAGNGYFKTGDLIKSTCENSRVLDSRLRKNKHTVSRLLGNISLAGNRVVTTKDDIA